MKEDEHDLSHAVLYYENVYSLMRHTKGIDCKDAVYTPFVDEKTVTHDGGIDCKNAADFLLGRLSELSDSRSLLHSSMRKEYLRLIDTQTAGPRCDVTPLFADPIAFAELIADLSEPFISTAIDYVAGIDALGFILGTAVALRLNKGFIPIRKGGKLPVAVTAREFVDYTGESKRDDLPTRARLTSLPLARLRVEI